MMVAVQSLLGGCASPIGPAADSAPSRSGEDRARARDLGIHIGEFASGEFDAITDVPGVRVGHATLHEGERFHTGVTVILPPGDNPLRDRCPAALVVQNGFGKFVGATQIMELGEIESPIALTGTLNVHRVADALLDYVLGLPGNERVRSVNVVVGETNDGRLSDIRARPVRAEHVAAAIAAATVGPVAVGAVGAGAGTVAFGKKGGIGTASRRVGAHTLGVLVQSNFGGSLTIDGWRYADAGPAASDHDGSCVIVLATDAPLDAAALRRLATRCFAGMARTGASFSHGSGDYALAFSTARAAVDHVTSLSGDALSPWFRAAADATEQAILDSLCAATTTRGPYGIVEALPLAPIRARSSSRR